MGKYRVRVGGEPTPEFTESPFTAAGKVNDPAVSEDVYSLAVGPLLVLLSAGERQNIVETWTALDEGRLGDQPARSK